MQKLRAGFTIVELLVVIVVIAILAAITVVAYNNIQDRATNAARIAAAKDTLTILELYRVQNQRYPELPDMPIPRENLKASCIGSNWPDSDTGKVCWNIYPDSHIGASTFITDNTVNAELSTVGTLPNYPVNSVARLADSSGYVADVAGLVLVYRTTPSTEFPVGYSVAYTLKGNFESTNCGVPGAVPSNIQDIVTRCVVPLPT